MARHIGDDANHPSGPPPSFSYGQVEEILSRGLRVAPDKRSALRSRLKQWQKMGFPHEERVGRGARAAYSLESLLQFCVMTRLLRLGLTPERAIRQIKQCWPDIMVGVLLSLSLASRAERTGVYAVLLGNSLDELMISDEDSDSRRIALVIEDHQIGLVASDPPNDKEGVFQYFVVRHMLNAGIVLDISALVQAALITAADVVGRELLQFSSEARAWFKRSRVRKEKSLSADHSITDEENEIVSDDDESSFRNALHRTIEPQYVDMVRLLIDEERTDVDP